MKPLHHKAALRAISLLLCLVFSTEGVFGHLPTVSVWSERQQKLRLKNILPPLLPSVTPAAPASVENILAALTGPFGRAKVVNVVPGAPVVVHIQDIHQNQEAQRHIAQALENLHSRIPVQTLALEGIFEAVGVERFRAYDDAEALNLAAKSMFEEQRLPGALYFAFTSAQAPPRITGIDDRALYDSNVNAFKTSAASTVDFKTRLDKAAAELANQKQAGLNPPLRAVDQAITEYRAGRLSLRGLIEALTAARPETIVPAPLARFMAAAALEEKIDFKTVEREREQWAHELARAHHTPDLKNIPAAYPALKNYVTYTELAKGIDGERLLAELTAFEKTVVDHLIQTETEHRLMTQSRQIYLQGKLLDFALTKPEWEEYETIDPSISIVDRLSSSSFSRFYLEAEARDIAMADNLLAVLPNKLAVIVTGGFHSAGIQAQLESEVTLISFTPALTKIDAENGSSYLSAFAREKTPLEKLFDGDKLFLSQRFWEMPTRLRLALGFLAQRLRLKRADTVEPAEINKLTNNTEPFELTVAGDELEVQFNRGGYLQVDAYSDGFESDERVAGSRWQYALAWFGDLWSRRPRLVWVPLALPLAAGLPRLEFNIPTVAYTIIRKDGKKSVYVTADRPSEAKSKQDRSPKKPLPAKGQSQFEILLDEMKAQLKLANENPRRHKPPRVVHIPITPETTEPLPVTFLELIANSHPLEREVLRLIYEKAYSRSEALAELNKKFQEKNAHPLATVGDLRNLEKAAIAVLVAMIPDPSILTAHPKGFRDHKGISQNVIDHRLLKDQTPRSSNRGGFSKIEVLVVLGILVAGTTALRFSIQPGFSFGQEFFDWHEKWRPVWEMWSYVLTVIVSVVAIWGAYDVFIKDRVAKKEAAEEQARNEAATLALRQEELKERKENYDVRVYLELNRTYDAIMQYIGDHPDLGLLTGFANEDDLKPEHKETRQAIFQRLMQLFETGFNLVLEENMDPWAVKFWNDWLEEIDRWLGLKEFQAVYSELISAQGDFRDFMDSRLAKVNAEKARKDSSRAGFTVIEFLIAVSILVAGLAAAVNSAMLLQWVAQVHWPLIISSFTFAVFAMNFNKKNNLKNLKKDLHDDPYKEFVLTHLDNYRARLGDYYSILDRYYRQIERVEETAENIAMGPATLYTKRLAGIEYLCEMVFGGPTLKNRVLGEPAILDKLNSETDRTLITLHWVNGKNFKEIAEELKLAHTTTRRQFLRAVSFLRLTTHFEYDFRQTPRPTRRGEVALELSFVYVAAGAAVIIALVFGSQLVHLPWSKILMGFFTLGVGMVSTRVHPDNYLSDEEFRGLFNELARGVAGARHTIAALGLKILRMEILRGRMSDPDEMESLAGESIVKAMAQHRWQEEGAFPAFLRRVFYRDVASYWRQINSRRRHDRNFSDLKKEGISDTQAMENDILRNFWNALKERQTEAVLGELSEDQLATKWKVTPVVIRKDRMQARLILKQLLSADKNGKIQKTVNSLPYYWALYRGWENPEKYIRWGYIVEGVLLVGIAAAAREWLADKPALLVVMIALMTLVAAEIMLIALIRARGQPTPETFLWSLWLLPRFVVHLVFLLPYLSIALSPHWFFVVHALSIHAALDEVGLRYQLTAPVKDILLAVICSALISLSSVYDPLKVVGVSIVVLFLSIFSSQASLPRLFRDHTASVADRRLTRYTRRGALGLMSLGMIATQLKFAVELIRDRAAVYYGEMAARQRLNAPPALSKTFDFLEDLAANESLLLQNMSIAGVILVDHEKFKYPAPYPALVFSSEHIDSLIAATPAGSKDETVMMGLLISDAGGLRRLDTEEKINWWLKTRRALDRAVEGETLPDEEWGRTNAALIEVMVHGVMEACAYWEKNEVRTGDVHHFLKTMPHPELRLDLLRLLSSYEQYLKLPPISRTVRNMKYFVYQYNTTRKSDDEGSEEEEPQWVDITASNVERLDLSMLSYLSDPEIVGFDLTELRALTPVERVQSSSERLVKFFENQKAPPDLADAPQLARQLLGQKNYEFVSPKPGAHDLSPVWIEKDSAAPIKINPAVLQSMSEEEFLPFLFRELMRLAPSRPKRADRMAELRRRLREMPGEITSSPASMKMFKQLVALGVREEFELMHAELGFRAAFASELNKSMGDHYQTMMEKTSQKHLIPHYKVRLLLSTGQIKDEQLFLALIPEIFNERDRGQLEQIYWTEKKSNQATANSAAEWVLQWINDPVYFNPPSEATAQQNAISFLLFWAADREDTSGTPAPPGFEYLPARMQRVYRAVELEGKTLKATSMELKDLTVAQVRALWSVAKFILNDYSKYGNQSPLMLVRNNKELLEAEFPDFQKQALILKFIDGYSQNEIARIIGKSLASAEHFERFGLHELRLRVLGAEKTGLLEAQIKANARNTVKEVPDESVRLARQIDYQLQFKRVVNVAGLRELFPNLGPVIDREIFTRGLVEDELRGFYRLPTEAQAPSKPQVEINSEAPAVSQDHSLYGQFKKWRNAGLSIHETAEKLGISIGEARLLEVHTIHNLEPARALKIKKDRDGFALHEVLIAVSILAVIAPFVLPVRISSQEAVPIAFAASLLSFILVGMSYVDQRHREKLVKALWEKRLTPLAQLGATALIGGSVLLVVGLGALIFSPDFSLTLIVISLLLMTGGTGLLAVVPFIQWLIESFYKANTEKEEAASGKLPIEKLKEIIAEARSILENSVPLVSIREHPMTWEDVDVALQRRLTELLRQAFPDDHVLEESKDPDRHLVHIGGQSETVWVLDGVDGARELAKSDHYAVSVGAFERGEAKMAMVYSPHVGYMTADESSPGKVTFESLARDVQVLTAPSTPLPAKNLHAIVYGSSALADSLREHLQPQAKVSTKIRSTVVAMMRLWHEPLEIVAQLGEGDDRNTICDFAPSAFIMAQLGIETFVLTAAGWRPALDVVKEVLTAGSLREESYPFIAVGPDPEAREIVKAWMLQTKSRSGFITIPALIVLALPGLAMFWPDLQEAWAALSVVAPVLWKAGLGALFLTPVFLAMAYDQQGKQEVAIATPHGSNYYPLMVSNLAAEFIESLNDDATGKLNETIGLALHRAVSDPAKLLSNDHLRRTYFSIMAHAFTGHPRLEPAQQMALHTSLLQTIDLFDKELFHRHSPMHGQFDAQLDFYKYYIVRLVMMLLESSMGFSIDESPLKKVFAGGAFQKIVQKLVWRYGYDDTFPLLFELLDDVKARLLAILQPPHIHKFIAESVGELRGQLAIIQQTLASPAAAPRVVPPSNPVELMRKALDPTVSVARMRAWEDPLGKIEMEMRGGLLFQLRPPAHPDSSLVFSHNGRMSNLLKFQLAWLRSATFFGATRIVIGNGEDYLTPVVDYLNHRQSHGGRMTAASVIGEVHRFLKNEDPDAPLFPYLGDLHNDVMACLNFWKAVHRIAYQYSSPVTVDVLLHEQNLAATIDIYKAHTVAVVAPNWLLSRQQMNDLRSAQFHTGDKGYMTTLQVRAQQAVKPNVHSMTKLFGHVAHEWMSQKAPHDLGSVAVPIVKNPELEDVLATADGDFKSQFNSVVAERADTVVATVEDKETRARERRPELVTHGGFASIEFLAALTFPVWFIPALALAATFLAFRYFVRKSAQPSPLNLGLNGFTFEQAQTQLNRGSVDIVFVDQEMNHQIEEIADGLSRRRPTLLVVEDAVSADKFRSRVPSARVDVLTAGREVFAETETRLRPVDAYLNSGRWQGRVRNYGANVFHREGQAAFNFEGLPKTSLFLRSDTYVFGLDSLLRVLSTTRASDLATLYRSAIRALLAA